MFTYQILIKLIYFHGLYSFAPTIDRQISIKNYFSGDRDRKKEIIALRLFISNKNLTYIFNLSILCIRKYNLI